MKKADLSLNIIIVAIIALLVMVVLAFIFTGRMQIFSIGINDCAKIVGAQCLYGQGPPNECGTGYVEYPSAKCLTPDKKSADPTLHCCLPQGVEEFQ